MTVQAVPYFAFDGDARQAMEFYHSVFGGELMVHSYGDGELVPPDDPAYDKMMHTSISGGVVTLGASDIDERFAGQALQVGNHLEVSLWGDDVEEGRRYFDALADGGEVRMPYESQSWGDVYGEVTDRFGRSWSVNVDPNG